MAEDITKNMTEEQKLAFDKSVKACVEHDMKPIVDKFGASSVGFELPKYTAQCKEKLDNQNQAKR